MVRDVPYESIPSGWYAVAESRDVRPGSKKSFRYFDRDLVLYRTKSGAPRLVGAYCPHLGAHLGRGTIEGERLRCPFHGFSFDGDGRCVATPYPGGRPPAKARLDSLPVREKHGMILAWFDRDGREPTWETPALDDDRFTRFASHSFFFRGHPQEISENSVDLGHFGPVHSYGSARCIEGPIVDGHLLEARYAVERSLDFAFLPGVARLEFTASVHGLGYSLVQAAVRKIGLEVMLLVLPTPVDAENVHFRVALRATKTPLRILDEALLRLMLRAYVHDVGLDVPIWASKRYVESPALAEGDGPIALYRRYAKQFYPPRRHALPQLPNANPANDAAE